MIIFQIQDSKHEKVPWKAIALAVFLAIGGMVQLTAGVLIFTGHIGKEVTRKGNCPSSRVVEKLRGWG